jgi:hypothetical protein
MMYEEARMNGVTVREQAVSTLNEMRDEDIEQVLEFMLLLKAEAEHLEHYDPTQDPVLTGKTYSTALAICLRSK